MSWTRDAQNMIEEEERRRLQAEVDRQIAVKKAEEAKKEEERQKIDGMAILFWELCLHRFQEIETLLNTQRSDALHISKPLQGIFTVFTVENDRDIGRAKPFVFSHSSEYMGGDDWYRDRYQVYGVTWRIQEVESGIQMTIFLGVKAIQKWVKKGIFPFRHEEMEDQYVPSLTASEVEIKVKEWLKDIYLERRGKELKAPPSQFDKREDADSCDLL